MRTNSVLMSAIAGITNFNCRGFLVEVEARKSDIGVEYWGFFSMDSNHNYCMISLSLEELREQVDSTINAMLDNKILQVRC